MKSWITEWNIHLWPQMLVIKSIHMIGDPCFDPISLIWKKSGTMHAE